jgi:catechol 2,3-dioxygenase-like lactoylglutathione lyase family enzyme
MDRPAMRITGPVLDAPDVAELARFYERLLGWDVEEIEGPRPGHPAGDGWARLRPADGSTKIEIQFEEHHVRPTWPTAPGAQGMQIHLDVWVEDVPAGVDWAVECGASEAEHQPADRDLDRLRVMLDPAGHPFCLWS